MSIEQKVLIVKYIKVNHVFNPEFTKFNYSPWNLVKVKVRISSSCKNYMFTAKLGSDDSFRWVYMKSFAYSSLSKWTWCEIKRMYSYNLLNFITFKSISMLNKDECTKYSIVIYNCNVLMPMNSESIKPYYFILNKENVHFISSLQKLLSLFSSVPWLFS